MIDPVDVLVLVAGFVFALSSAPLRTARTYAFLAALAVAFVGADLYQHEPARFIVKVGVMCIYVLAIFRFQPVLMGIPRSHGQVDQRLTAISNDVNAALANWQKARRDGDGALESARGDVIDVCEKAIIKLDSTHAPSIEWEQTVTLMRRYLLAVRNAAIDHDDSREPSRSPGPTAAGLEVMRDEVTLAWAKATHPG